MSEDRISEDRIKEMAEIAAEAAEDKKAEDIEILKVKGLTIIADYFVICSGNSETQVKAIARGIEEDLEEKEIVPRNRAGVSAARWILLDYSDIIVHIFHRQEREFYELERLWADAKKILSETQKQ